MKKLLIASLVSSLLVGCGSGGSSSTASVPTPEQPTPTPDQPKPSYPEGFVSAMNQIGFTNDEVDELCTLRDGVEVYCGIYDNRFVVDYMVIDENHSVGPLGKVKYSTLLIMRYNVDFNRLGFGTGYYYAMEERNSIGVRGLYEGMRVSYTTGSNTTTDIGHEAKPHFQMLDYPNMGAYNVGYLADSEQDEFRNQFYLSDYTSISSKVGEATIFDGDVGYMIHPELEISKDFTPEVEKAVTKIIEVTF